MTAPQLIVSGIRQAGASAIVVGSEELVTAPEPAVRQLCDELGIVFHPGMLEYAAAAAGSERWLYGDQGTVYQEQSPVAGRAERWRDVLKEARVWAAWARGYTTALGPDIVREFWATTMRNCVPNCHHPPGKQHMGSRHAAAK